MKKIKYLILSFLSVLALTGFLPQVSAEEVKHEFSVGPYASYIKYEEPDVMEETGFMAGVFADYSAHYTQGIVFGADGTLSAGQVDYDSVSTGSIDGIDDFMGEVRGSVGYDIAMSGETRATPYVGFGYRFLRDETGGMISTTGAAGYDRETEYLYVPVGIKTMSNLNSDWKFGFNIEYDVFIDGTQKSELGDVVAGVDTLENDQDDGYGVRGSIKLVKTGEKYSILVEPFIRYWNIEDSDLQSVSIGGTPIGIVGIEPENNSFEAGFKVGFNY